MNISPIPHELGRFYVQSESRPDVAFVVDLRYQESAHSKPVPACGCENYMASGNTCCKHLPAVAAYELRRLGL